MSAAAVSTVSPAIRIRRKRSFARAWWAKVALAHIAADLACNRAWSCACGACREAREALDGSATKKSKPAKRAPEEREHPNLTRMRELKEKRVFSSLTQGPSGERVPEYILRVSWSAAFDPMDDGRGHLVRRGEVTANLGIEGVLDPPFTNREMQDITFAAKMAVAKCLRLRKQKPKHGAT